MKHKLMPSLCALVWAVLSALAQAEGITSARYLEPTARYGHFALGRPHEYARVVATTSAGRTLELALPEDEVFEDLAPRLVRIGPSDPQEILAIVSRRHDGARLVLLRVQGDRLTISAQTPPVGTPMRWLNPVGVADLDGDGQAEVAMVTTPHIGGVLRVFRREGARLVELARQPGFSNHVYGSAELGLSTFAAYQGRMSVVVPAFGRRALRVIGLQGGRLVDLAACALPADVTGSIELVAPGELSVGLSQGRHTVKLATCAPA